MAEQSFIEQIKVTGEELVDKVEHLLHEGNVRRVVIKQDEHTIAEFPLTVGVIGIVIAPILAAVGALAVMLTDCTIEVEREENPADNPAEVHNTSPEEMPHH